MPRCRSAMSARREYVLPNRRASVRLRPGTGAVGWRHHPGAHPDPERPSDSRTKSLVLDGFLDTTGRRPCGASRLRRLAGNYDHWTSRGSGLLTERSYWIATAGTESSTRISTGAVRARGAWRARRRSANERRFVRQGGSAQQAPGTDEAADRAAEDRTSAGLTAAVRAKTMRRI
jgi:hypothetical protein